MLSAQGNLRGQRSEIFASSFSANLGLSTQAYKLASCRSRRLCIRLLTRKTAKTTTGRTAQPRSVLRQRIVRGAARWRAGVAATIQNRTRLSSVTRVGDKQINAQIAQVHAANIDR